MFCLILFTLIVDLISLFWPKQRRISIQHLENFTFCKYHQIHGYSTNECQSFHTKIQQYIDLGIIKLTCDNEWHISHNLFHELAS